MNNGGKYTKARHQMIVKAIRAGNYRSTAARLSGISPQALSRWLDQGSAGEEPYAALFEDIETAEAEWEAEHLANIDAAANSRKPGTWTASAWQLERRKPEKFGRRDGLVIEGGDRPIQVATHHLFANPEQMQALLGNLTELGGRAPVAELVAGEDDVIEEGEFDVGNF